jgi:hypothetical protein
MATPCTVPILRGMITGSALVPPPLDGSPFDVRIGGVR